MVSVITIQIKRLMSFDLPCEWEKKTYTRKIAYHFHMELNIRTWMTNIGRITFPASFNTTFVKGNITVDFTSIK